MKKWLSFSALNLLLIASQSLAQSQSACANLKDYQAPNSNLQLTAAEFYQSREMRGPFGPPSVLPPHCHVEGEIDRRTGSDGKSYALRFAINLPENWNGRYFFQGGGGLNGTVGEPVGNQVAGDNSALSRGFAVVSTDSGHQGAVFDGSFLAEQEAALNFFFLGNMRVTETTKPIVEAYYQKPINKSYFVGCSTGGREGMIMAQRFPYLYDGIVSGAPAMMTSRSNLALRWINVQLNQIKPKDEKGLPVAGPFFSKPELKTIADGMLQACDALDGAKDELIFNTTACQFDPMTIACKPGQTTACLDPKKSQALAKAMAGPVDSRGIQVYPGFMYDTGIDDDLGFNKGLINGGANPPEGPSPATWLSQDVDAEYIAATAFDRSIGDAVSYNLSSFFNHGGKQIFYHGVSDAWFSALATVEYYEKLTQGNGGHDQVYNQSRLFLSPGMAHCAGGEKSLDNFDMLTAIVDWVENDKAPQHIIATGRTMPGVSRPLCPYPQHPHYNGKGDVNAAENFECRE